jgi:pimeloyl-ACP methyl ester carboxylesterase
MDHSFISGHAPINGIDMYYEVHGNGPVPLVLVHGGGSTIETTFGQLIPLLAGRLKLIAVELQAHGRTSDRNAPESFEQDADDVAALLKYLKVGQADILGFSNGGTTTLQIAHRHPGLVRKTIVIAANYQREGLITGFFEGLQQATLDHMPEMLKAAYLKVNPDQKGLQNMFNKDRQRMLDYEDISDELVQSIGIPVLLMAGDRDVITCEHILKMSRLIKDSRLVILPGTHGAIIATAEAGDVERNKKQAEISAGLILDFLKG